LRSSTVDPLKDHPGAPAGDLRTECLESFLKELWGSFLKANLSKPGVEASEELLREHLKEPL
jgi:hypothetical protein